MHGIEQITNFRGTLTNSLVNTLLGLPGIRTMSLHRLYRWAAQQWTSNRSLIERICYDIHI
jgi:hypothetical protein